MTLVVPTKVLVVFGCNNQTFGWLLFSSSQTNVWLAQPMSLVAHLWLKQPNLWYVPITTKLFGCANQTYDCFNQPF